MRKATFADPTRGTVAAAGRKALDVAGICDYLFQENSFIGDRTRADASMGEQSLVRGVEKRDVNLSRLVLYEQLAAGPSVAASLVLIMRNRKGRSSVSTASLLRHKILSMCARHAFRAHARLYIFVFIMTDFLIACVYLAF